MPNNQNKIQNPKTPVPETPQMNDRDFINDLLATEKHITNSYSTAMHEASHKGLYNDIFTAFTESSHLQRDIYDLMFKKGWYGIQQADAQGISQSYQQFNGYKSQFPFGNIN
ncbi:MULTISPECIES: spore coat protein [Bacillus]|uniref:spore coat protein n=1 Tax=Bacillus TaxID=1386 RepID=UPI000306726A|nr:MULTISPECIES: spore coat protein [Bacillus]